MVYSYPFWIGFHVVILALLFLDLFVVNKTKNKESVSKALLWTVGWVCLAMVFNLFIFIAGGPQDALQFFTGYIIEKSLSVDNIFVFLIVFSSLNIARVHQRKILFWGILGALVLRLALILLGVELLERYLWMYYIFGAFLCVTALRFLIGSKEKKSIQEGFVYKLAKKYLPISGGAHDGKFMIKQRGKIYFTSTFLALLVIETADVIFALDSIPAILAVTQQPFIVYTSNVFAILGLRSLFMVVSHFQEKLYYFSYGLAAILFFIGAKMLLSDWIHISVVVTLFVISMILLMTYVMSSLMLKKRK